MFSCSSNKSVKHQLQLADNLTTDCTDSAYAILKQIDPQDVKGSADNAHYALLYTQAQYKNYETIASDSLINIAVEYYTGKEKYDVALMYKGAALSDMGFNHEAMRVYKKAEEHTDSTNYLQLGLLNLRLGELYQYSYNEKAEHITKYKQALCYFKKANHLIYQLNCLGRLGQSYRLKNTDSALMYQHQAINLATELEDSRELVYNYATLSGTYYLNKEYAKSKEVALFALNDSRSKSINEMCYHVLSKAYANLKQIDSALYYLNKLSVANSPGEQVKYLSSRLEIEKVKGDYKYAFNTQTTTVALADSIMDCNRTMGLLQIEKEYDKMSLVKQNEILQLKHLVSTFIFLSLISIVVFVAYIAIRRYRNRISQQLEQINLIRLEYEKDKSEIVQNPSNEYSNIIESNFKLIGELIEAQYMYDGDTKRILDEYNKILSASKWSQGAFKNLCNYTDLKYNGILSRLRSEYSCLSETDICLIAMVCNKFPSSVISLIMNYVNSKSIYTKKCRLALKMKFSGSLETLLVEKIEQTTAYITINQQDG